MLFCFSICEDAQVVIEYERIWRKGEGGCKLCLHHIFIDKAKF
jgi:hypothetical protein